MGLRMMVAGLVVLFQQVVLLHAQETTFERVRRTGSITLVADRNALPYASMRPDLPGIDVELAQRLADTLGIQLYYKWISTLFESGLSEVIKGEADLMLGVALDSTQVGPGGETLGNHVEFTVPYYSTGYVAVGKTGLTLPARLRDAGKSVGVERGAFAEHELKQWGLDVRAYPNQMAVLAALRRGDVAVGSLWADAGYLIKDNPGLEVRIVRDYVPEKGLRVNIGGAVRPEEDRRFSEFVNRGLQNLITSGVVGKVLAKYAIPYFSPMSEAE